MTTNFKRVRKLDFKADVRKLVDIVNQLVTYTHQDTGPQKVGVLATVTAASYTVLDNDYLIPVDTTSNAITINLPAIASSDGRVLKIKRISGGGNAITIDGSGSETIDGAATQTITVQWKGYELTCDAAVGWYITAIMG